MSRAEIVFPFKLDDDYPCRGDDARGREFHFNDLLAEGEIVGARMVEGEGVAPWGRVTRKADGLWIVALTEAEERERSQKQLAELTRGDLPDVPDEAVELARIAYEQSRHKPTELAITDALQAAAPHLRSQHFAEFREGLLGLGAKAAGEIAVVKEQRREGPGCGCPVCIYLSSIRAALSTLPDVGEGEVDPIQRDYRRGDNCDESATFDAHGLYWLPEGEFAPPLRGRRMPELRWRDSRLTPKQTRRAWRCLDKMSKNRPGNPMDFAAVTRAARENMEAAGKLAWACMDAAEEEGAEAVNESIGEAEDILGLERVDA